MRRYNDYELIYMYRNCCSEEALAIMMNKYMPLIYKKISKYAHSTTEFDDYVQECLIVLHRGIITFKESFNKTFTKYYELLLRRRLLYLQYRRPKYEIHEHLEIYPDIINEEFYLEGLTKNEEEVFTRYFVQNQKIAFIAESTGKSVKQIYNAVYRIREKYKNY